MLVIPAIDLRDGACVRLREGDPSTAIVYDDNPVRRARDFVSAGARRLHVVDLDAAFGSGDNLATIERICSAVDVPVQSGGGIRSPKRASALIDAGIAEIILGTVLAESPAIAAQIVERFPQRVIAGIDARGTRVATRGWQSEPGIDRDRLLLLAESLGIERIIFTEISRDGTGQGFDLETLNAVAAKTACRITASGGARTMLDIEALAAGAHKRIDSCIVGSAFYQGTITELAISSL